MPKPLTGIVFTEGQAKHPMPAAGTSKETKRLVLDFVQAEIQLKEEGRFLLELVAFSRKQAALQTFLLQYLYDSSVELTPGWEFKIN